MTKTNVSKGTGILLLQLLDLKSALNEMKKGVNHDYSSGNNNEALKKAYNTFQNRKSHFTKQLAKLKGELADKEYADVKALVNGDFDKVNDKSALLNRYHPPAYPLEDIAGWTDFSKEELNTLRLDNYKVAGAGGSKFLKNNKYIDKLKSIIDTPQKIQVSFEEEKKVEKKSALRKKKEASGGASGEASGEVDVYFDGTQSATEINALSSEQKDLINELTTAYEKQENPEKIYSIEYSNLRKHPRFNGIDIDMMEKMLLLPAYKANTEDVVVEDAPNPEVEKDPDAVYIPVGQDDTDPDSIPKEDDTDSLTTQKSTPITISTLNTRQSDGTNSEYTIGDSTARTDLLGGTSNSGTMNDDPPYSKPADPYSKLVDVSTLDLNELRERLRTQPQLEVEKAVKTGVFTGFGTVPEVVVEEVSRTTGEIPSTPQEAVNMPTGNEVEEEKARNKKDIERLKEEIRGLHKTFDVLIPALREKTHQLRFKLAMSSKDKKVVMKHHAEMLERVRIYFGGGQGNNLKVGVVVPLDSYMSSFFSGVNSGEGDISNITKQPQPKGERQTRGSGSKIVAKSIYYQRGGMGAVKGQAVTGHQVPSTLIKTRRGKIADPLQVVDAPYEYVLNRKGTVNSKAVSGLKIKSRK